jgi:dihydrolipoamide dehydrogenase
MVVGDLRQEAELVVIGGGPGGYVAAIRAADLGREVMLIEERERPGGVCLLEGCIPSKALINAAEARRSMLDGHRFGIVSDGVHVDLDALRRWTAGVVDGLVGGVESLLKSRGIEVIQGRARFSGPRSLSLEGSEVSGVDFRKAIIATGSRPMDVSLGEGLALWTSREALDLPEIPERLLVVGGGYIGLELGMVYAGLGSSVTLVEAQDRLLAGVDDDLVKVVARTCREQFESVRLSTKLVSIKEDGASFVVTLEKGGSEVTLEVDRVLLAVGRRPNTDDLGLKTIGLTPDSRGFIEVDAQRRTAVPDVFAIGDVTHGPMLAHKASREGKVAAEVIAGLPAAFDNRTIPAVVFTDPELAVTGLTETEAKARNIDVRVGRFPLTALGRARTMGRTEGFAKVLSDPESGLVLGLGIVSAHASELIAEGTLAIEMGARLEDLMVTIHAHPTLSEANMEAAEVAAGVSVHQMPRKR